MKGTFSRFASAVLVALASAPATFAAVKLPAVVSSNMVLQRDMPVPIWGFADAGEDVTVTFAGQSRTTKTGADGRWMVKLDRLAASGEGRALVVKGTNSITVDNVLVGEVWLASGQSNMAMTVNRANDFEREQASAKLPQVRMFTTAGNAQPRPQNDCRGTWNVCAPDTVGRFSATAYFFARELHKTLGVPVGILNSSVGGTPIENWISAEAQQKTPELKPFLESQRKPASEKDLEELKTQYQKQLQRWEQAAAKAKAAKQPIPRKPRDPVESAKRKGNVGGLFNGMIHPLIPYAIRGAIWYQGEANTHPGKSQFYPYQLPLLVSDWRARWNQGDFPFAWVQLPNFTRPGEGWPLVREAMLKSLKVPNTGMAITIDIGDPKDIHPKTKQEVGRRLSLWALGTVYGQKLPATSGPLPAGHRIDGSSIILCFSHADGLQAKDGQLKGFVIAGEDRKFVPATARIDGNKVIVSHPSVTKPVAVRYAWADLPDCNLYNGANLPASPFRTDDWPPDAP